MVEKKMRRFLNKKTKDKIIKLLIENKVIIEKKKKVNGSSYTK